jgi:hypothetical protein
MFALEGVCGETENERENKKTIMWMHDIFVSRCNEDKFHTLFQRMCKAKSSWAGFGWGLR